MELLLIAVLAIALIIVWSSTRDALDRTRSNINRLQTEIDFLRSQLSIAFTTEDIQEGVKAFFEKREPNWTGR